ncbi:MAG TPA: nucleoside triphosphate pyrophosphohydrolase [Afifellaceae bacterium]|nr:nucleoside triphosphate pyrophosphohydrolase [Afifellaceae bacterium]
MPNAKPIDRLIEIMAALRTPGSGCPWDLEQDFTTIAPYTIEEAYEVADAIERGDMDDLKDELGDLLLQVVFHARMAEEAGAFAFNDVADAISEKMIRRHPHVFADIDADNAAAVKANWEEIKAAEKAARKERLKASGTPDDYETFLADVPMAIPALQRAFKLQKRAARIGFDWPELEPVLGKVREELDELTHEIGSNSDADRLQDEMGDLLFAVANLARHLNVDPETALRGTNAKFVRRFEHIETALRQTGRSLESASLDEMEEIWVAAKQAEKGQSEAT